MKTLRQTAVELGLSLSTVQHQAKAGRLRAEKFGRDWLVTDAEIARYRLENLGHVGRPPNPESPSTNRPPRTEAE